MNELKREKEKRERTVIFSELVFVKLQELFYEHISYILSCKQQLMLLYKNLPEADMVRRIHWWPATVSSQTRDTVVALPVQLPADAPGKAAGDSPSTGTPSTRVGDLDGV